MEGSPYQPQELWIAPQDEGLPSRFLWEQELPLPWELIWSPQHSQEGHSKAGIQYYLYVHDSNVAQHTSYSKRMPSRKCHRTRCLSLLSYQASVGKKKKCHKANQCCRDLRWAQVSPVLTSLHWYRHQKFPKTVVEVCGKHKQYGREGIFFKKFRKRIKLKANQVVIFLLRLDIRSVWIWQP